MQPFEFSKFRSFVWPIHGYELKKCLPMGFMMFLVLFNYTMLRNAKDALVITHSGPEVIPFLKGWVIMPVSILFVTLYAKISNILSQRSVFYICIFVFVLFYSIFALYLYPNYHFLHPDPHYIADLKQQHPHFQHLISLYGIWTSTLFYLFSELWGAIVLNLLFWHFANFITRTTEAKRFYGIYAFLGHFALIFAGIMAKWFCSFRKTCSPGTDVWGGYLNMVIISIIISSIVIIGIYWWMNKYVLTDKRYFDETDTMKGKNSGKTKLSLKESFKRIASSPYLGLIFLLILCYGFSMNLLGIIWKKQLKLQYPDPIDYSDFMGTFSLTIGILTVLIIFFSKGIVQKFGWFRGAIVTPLVVLTTSVIFFIFIFFREELTPWLSVYHLTPLLMAVLVGAAQQIISKSAKYSLFDPTKEMAYIPLDVELKSKGKAAVDVSGHSLSKASGGYFSGTILIIFAISDLMTIAPYLAAVVIGTAGLWIFAVYRLNQRYVALTERNAQFAKTQNAINTDPVKSDEKLQMAS